MITVCGVLTNGKPVFNPAADGKPSPTDPVDIVGYDTDEEMLRSHSGLETATPGKQLKWHSTGIADHLRSATTPFYDAGAPFDERITACRPRPVGKSSTMVELWWPTLRCCGAKRSRRKPSIWSRAMARANRCGKHLICPGRKHHHFFTWRRQQVVRRTLLHHGHRLAPAPSLGSRTSARATSPGKRILPWHA